MVLATRLGGSCVLALSAVAGCLWLGGPARAYSWPVKPFHEPHAIRGAFDDPRFHLGPESELSAFHFGVDIAVKDGTAVYAVAPGYVRKRSADVTVRTRGGRAFGYWHIRPVVRTGQHVRLHQLLGYVRPGWGHVHFAEAVGGEYRNPLRKGALTPFYDHTPPTVGSIRLVSSADGSAVDPGRVSGSVDVQAEISDAPPVPPRPPWQVARLTPAIVWWKLFRAEAPVTDWNLSVDFHFALMPASLYWTLYAPGTYQNKANRPGKYLFWLTHGLDTATLPNGPYELEVLAADSRWNLGSSAIDFTVANAVQEPPAAWAPGIAIPGRTPA